MMLLEIVAVYGVKNIGSSTRNISFHCRLIGIIDSLNVDSKSVIRFSKILFLFTDWA